MTDAQPASPAMSRVAAMTVIAAIVIDAAVPFVARVSGVRMLGVASAAMVVMAAVVRDPAAVVLTLLLAFKVGWHASGTPAIWPVYLLGPLVAWSLALLVAPRLRATTRTYWQVGRIDRRVVPWMIATVAISSSALWLWLRFAHPDIRDLIAAIPPLGAATLVAVGLGFAVVNAAMEELVWRGAIMDGLHRVTRSPVLALTFQAVSFGLAHVHGFPRGVLGIAMAGTYGAMLGWIRHRSSGLLAPFVTHVAADATIFALLVHQAHRA